LYRLDNMSYPTTQQGLKALVQRPDDPNLKTWPEGGYFARIPKDPWGRGYNYVSPGEHGEIDIFTLGRDGRAGGDGLDSTIGNWNLRD
jgi:general secretion pathway protein G